MKKIEISNIKEYIDAAPMDMNIMFVGDTGIGKTSQIIKYAEEKGSMLKILVLSQLRPDEALGIPFRSEIEIDGVKHNILDTLTPKWVLDLAKEENPILFLDEFLTAKPDVMNAFLSFLTEREVNGINLKHVRIVAATNIGIYTNEPDLNILSRFCMFHAINTTFNEYVNDNRIVNDYQDETNENSVVFEERSLKPRAQFQLKSIEDKYLSDFYEGFTNKKMGIMFCAKSNALNACLNELYNIHPNDKKVLTLNKDNAGLFVQHVKRIYPRLKNVNKILSGFVNVEFEDVDGKPFDEWVNDKLSV